MCILFYSSSVCENMCVSDKRDPVWVARNITRHSYLNSLHKSTKTGKEVELEWFRATHPWMSIELIFPHFVHILTNEKT